MSNEEIVKEIDEAMESLRETKRKIGGAFSKARNIVIKDSTVDTEAYNKGLEDGRNEVWELAKKIDFFDEKERAKIFGYLTSEYIKERYTVQEALAKLEAYEKEQNEIKVGDVVRANNYPNYEFVVCYIHISEIGGYATYGGITEKGTWFANDDVKKTGKHIDIQSVLEQIKE